MNQDSITDLPVADFPALLGEIPQPPTNLNYRGHLPAPTLPLLTVVGSRRYSNYGRQVVDYLIDGLRGYQIGIVSGLALGIDSLAHEAALRNQLYTLAIPGSGLSDEVLYPRTHCRLARHILDSGGALLSEFKPDYRATKWSFIERNRLMAGISSATLVIEATEQSGTLTTARMCVDYNRELLVVPGNIFSVNSRGPHLFLKLGATPVTSPADIINHLKLEPTPGATPNSTTQLDLSLVESQLLNYLQTPADIETIIVRSGLNVTEVSVALMQLEIKGLVATNQGQYRLLI